MARFPEQAYEEMAAYCMDRIRHICESFGVRPPGSEGERLCQEYLSGELSQAGLEPQLETFPVAQKAFMAVPAICCALGLAAVLCAFILPPIAPVIAGLAILLFGLEIVLYKHVLTPIFPKSESRNLYAVIKPKKEMRRRLILGGHADAAFEWRYNQSCPKRFKGVAGLIVLSVLWIWVASLAKNFLSSDAAEIVLNCSLLPAAAGMMLGLFFTRFSVVAKGAVDNLSGALVGVAVARAMKNSGAEADHTEIIVLTSGSEEAGLCGAKFFAERHKAQWHDVPTAYIALDSFRDLPHFYVYNKDLNGIVRHDPDFCALLQQAGHDCGLELAYATVTVGSSDAAAFTQAGIHAALLCAMDPKPAHYYHNRRDDWPILDKDCLLQAARVVVAAIDRYDALASKTDD